MLRYLSLSLLILSVLAACSSQQTLDIALKDQPKPPPPKPSTHIPKQNLPITMYRQFLTRLRDRLESEWGDRDILIASRHQYVKYTQNYKSRAVIDFDKGLITIETLDKRPLVSLRKAIVTTLMTPDDPNSVDLFSTKAVSFNGRPFLYGLVLDQNQKSIDNKKNAELFARYLLNKERQTRYVQTAEGKRKLYSISLTMIRNHINVRARRFAPLVERFAQEFGVSKSLIYAVMKTESNFNLFAVSSAPAYGLMQLVPATGGRDAYLKVTGKDKIPSVEYLFDAENNIQLGTAYLSMINDQFLAEVTNPISREYCAISAYNGGIGSVLRSFNKSKAKAIQIINDLTPAEVYDHLRTKHPAGETRRYLAKVLSAKREFVNL